MAGAPLTEKQRHWLAHIERAKSNEQPLSIYAKENDLNASSLYQYHKLLREKGWLCDEVVSSSFISVVQRPNETSRCILNFPNGIRLELDGQASVSEELLRRVYAL